jgi:hypothetical protein
LLRAPRRPSGGASSLPNWRLVANNLCRTQQMISFGAAQMIGAASTIANALLP